MCISVLQRIAQSHIHKSRKREREDTKWQSFSRLHPLSHCSLMYVSSAILIKLIEINVFFCKPCPCQRHFCHRSCRIHQMNFKQNSNPIRLKFYVGANTQQICNKEGKKISLHILISCSWNAKFNCRRIKKIRRKMFALNKAQKIWLMNKRNGVLIVWRCGGSFGCVIYLYFVFFFCFIPLLCHWTSHSLDPNENELFFPFETNRSIFCCRQIVFKMLYIHSFIPTGPKRLCVLTWLFCVLHNENVFIFGF